MEKKLCKCGCGAEVRGVWVRGHHARVNNPSKRADVKEKRRDMFLRMHEDGRLGTPWNMGLTKEDPRVATYAATHSSHFSEEHREAVSVAMKRSWKTGAITPLTGPDHSQWNGGTSRITERMRGSHRLYKLWKRPILERDGFLCQLCGSGERLIVHHDKERFAEILRKVLVALFPDADRRELTFAEGTIVVSAVVDYHVNEHVSGLTLCEVCHDREHGRALAG